MDRHVAPRLGAADASVEGLVGLVVDQDVGGGRGADGVAEDPARPEGHRILATARKLQEQSLYPIQPVYM